MTQKEFEAILNVARKEYDRYQSLKGNYEIPVTRKEDHLAYWIAYIAREQGRYEKNES